MKRQMARHRVTNCTGVKSVDEYSSKVIDNFPKHAVPGMSYFVLSIDIENNAFADMGD